MYDGGTNAVNNIKGIHSDGEKRRIGVGNSGKQESKSEIESRNHSRSIVDRYVIVCLAVYDGGIVFINLSNRTTWCF